MDAIINRDDAPRHLFNILDLDFSDDVFAERVSGPWFRLAAWTLDPYRDERGVETVVERQSLLIPPNTFSDIFDQLSSVGNVIHILGKPGGSVLRVGEKREYRYFPFHRFEFSFTSAVGEPLVFANFVIAGVQLLINPDIMLYFRLEERTPGSGIWWDPRRGVDALCRRVIDQGHLATVEIRIDYMRKYLQARQISLLVAHYRHLHLFDPSPETIGLFVNGDVILGSPERGAKAIFQNWGLRADIPGSGPFLQRRLHLWFEIRPLPIDIEDPWSDEPSFDPYTFTLPTQVGLVAPARWKHFRQTEGRTFEGEVCDFMDSVYFRQEVLTKYEGASGFDVGDNGSVSCHHYWGLVRSTARVGNELLATGIGDFAGGVPFEEWPHWKQYAVEFPSLETVQALRQEQTVPEAINSLVKALATLNTAFAGMASSFGVASLCTLWRGSLDSLAGRQLKWVYPSTADDDEFLKRATLTSTLVIEALEPPSLRKLLNAMGGALHMNDDNPPRPLGSRNLLQRITLIALLIEDFRPNITEIQSLVRQAEGSDSNVGDPDLQADLRRLQRRVRDEFAPLAFLYDMRTFGGLAHTYNKARATAAAAQLGFPEKNWHRTDFLRLLNLIEASVYQISGYLSTAAQVIASDGLP